MVRYLRIAFSAVCLFAGVLIIAFWVRSYRAQVLAEGPFAGGLKISIHSFEGRLIVGAMQNESPHLDRWNVYHSGLERPQDIRKFYKTNVNRYSFGAIRTPDNVGFVVPDWLLLLVSAALAAVPWVKDPFHFRLRALLLMLTLAAAICGLAWI